jgi:hypothetical protein
MRAVEKYLHGRIAPFKQKWEREMQNLFSWVDFFRGEWYKTSRLFFEVPG